MRFVTAFALLLVAIAASAADALHTPRLSGTVTRIQTRGIVDSSFPKLLPGREVRLYSKKPDVKCCRNEDLFRTTLADKKAHFKFKNVPRGEYWVAIKEDFDDFVAPVIIDRRGWNCAGDTVRLLITESEMMIESACRLELS